MKDNFKAGIRCTICGGWHHPQVVHLDYVGHAALTDRLLDIDPLWYWEPVSFDSDGLPAFDKTGGLWIRLYVCGHSRLGYGNAAGSEYKDIGSREKEVIGDALRNAAMRFGAALEFWHKGDLHLDKDPPKRNDADFAALLTGLREASLNGTEALKEAVAKLPSSDEINMLLVEHKLSLWEAAKKADKPKETK